MKKRTALALALALALLAGCGAAGENQAGNARTNSAMSDLPDPAGALDAQQEAYSAYLDVLAENRENILGYDWQKGIRFDEEIYEVVPAGDAAPVVFADVWGDETPELIFLSAAGHDDFRYAADLHVYTWDEDGAREVCATYSMDSQAGGGSNYRLFQTRADKGLWVYNLYYSEGSYETYTHFTTEGDMEPRLICEHGSYPAENPGEEYWTLDELWLKNGEECTRETYEAEIPAQEEQAQGLLMRNAIYYEYTEDVEAPGDAYSYPENGAALTYDQAVAYLRDKLDIQFDAAVDETEFFGALPDRFTFSSGVGGWGTELSIGPDGSFTGEYHDSNMGEDGPDYPYGTVYLCSFSGRFGDVARVDDYTYSMRLLELNIDRPIDEEWIEDGVRYVSAAPYGLDNAGEFMVYLPGSWVEGLPYEFVSWVSMPRAWSAEDRPVLLPFYGLYNVKGREGFSSFDYVPDNGGGEVSAQWATRLRAAANCEAIHP